MALQTIYLFESFRLDIDSRLLLKENVSVNLPDKEYFLLLYFLEHPGRMISRQEIFETLWKGRVVEDVALRFAINYLRKALGDDPKTPRYIQTVWKSGYRFLPLVTMEFSRPEKIVA